MVLLDLSAPFLSSGPPRPRPRPRSWPSLGRVRGNPDGIMNRSTVAQLTTELQKKRTNSLKENKNNCWMQKSCCGLCIMASSPKGQKKKAEEQMLHFEFALLNMHLTSVCNICESRSAARWGERLETNHTGFRRSQQIAERFALT